MKHFFCIVCCACVVLSFASAKSKKKKEPPVEVIGREVGEDGQEYEVMRRVSRKKGFLGFGVEVPPIDLGMASMSLKRILPGQVAKSEALVQYYPTQDEIVLSYRQLQKFFPCFDKEMRKKCAEAFALYKDDFDKKRLDKRSRNVEKVYGHRRGKIRWGLVNGGETARPDVKFGYEFIKKSPYFKITFDEAVADHPGQSEENAMVFHGMTLLFNRAQMEDLLAFMDERKIDEAMIIRVPVAEQEKLKDDVYEEVESVSGEKSEAEEYMEAE